METQIELTRLATGSTVDTMHHPPASGEAETYIAITVVFPYVLFLGVRWSIETSKFYFRFIEAQLVILHWCRLELYG